MFDVWNYHKFYDFKLDLTSRKLSFLINQTINQVSVYLLHHSVDLKSEEITIKKDLQRIKRLRKAVATGQADCSACNNA